MSQLLFPVCDIPELCDNEIVKAYLDVFVDMPERNPLKDGSMICGFQGMEEFLKTGRLPEIYGKYMPVIPEKLRHVMEEEGERI